MKLWTWQDERLNITNATQRVQSREFSTYLGGNCPREYRERHRLAYEGLWQRIGDDQFLWYHTDRKAAEICRDGYISGQRVYWLWEVEIDKTSILRMVCPIIWVWIIEGKCNSQPPVFWDEYWEKNLVPGLRRDEFRAAFNQSFDESLLHLTSRQLWDRLFVGWIIPGCTQVLLRHPVDPSAARRSCSSHNQ